MARIKGTKITSKLAFIRQTWGDDALEDILILLQEDDQRVVRSAIDLGWYPAELYTALIGAIVERRAPNQNPLPLLESIGQKSADLLAEGNFRTYYRSKDPSIVLSKPSTTDLEG